LDRGLLTALVLAGLVRRRHLGAGRAFTSGLAPVLVAEVLVVGWPERLRALGFRAFKPTLFDALKMTSAIEIACWIVAVGTPDRLISPGPAAA
jgi:hypothetical protein